LVQYGHTSWFKPYLTNIFQYVQHKEEISAPGKTDIGVPQGRILPCIVFAFLLNDIPYHLKNIFAMLFADDSISPALESTTPCKNIGKSQNNNGNNN